MCLHLWPFACYKKLLDRTSYFPKRDVHPTTEGWAQVQRQKIFGAHKFDYLVYPVTHDGVMPIPKKVKDIQVLAVSKTRKKMRQFIVMINFYCDMWQKRYDILSPLTALTSNNVKYDFKDEH